MLQLTYISTVRDAAKVDLGDILRVSRANNRRDRITGLLHYDGRRFLQALEGPAALVEAAYARIRVDPRHFAPVVLSQRPIDAREFGNWDMAALEPGDDRDAFVARITALVANASPIVRATFEGRAGLRAA